jgi:serine kinase of HPr protein (carbohydrate metabolism regulator)
MARKRATNGATPLTAHATAVAIAGVGVLLRGRSGAGKSDLALRLLDQGAVLIGDDYVELTVRAGRLWARPPRQLAGQLEVRGLGIMNLPYKSHPIGLVADLAPPAQIERMPKPRQTAYLGVWLPVITVAPFQASAAAKLRLAARAVKKSRLPAAKDWGFGMP